jgi:hypothetical protein
LIYRLLQIKFNEQIKQQSIANLSITQKGKFRQKKKKKSAQENEEHNHGQETSIYLIQD